MKIFKKKSLRRAVATLSTSLVLGGMCAAKVSAQGIYLMKSNYVAGTVAPYNSGGGVPAAAILNLNTNTTTNATLSWYGTLGWYNVQGSPDFSTWTTLGTVEGLAYLNSVTVTNPYGASAFFRLAQNNFYAGSDQCSSCHGDKYNGWKTTPHSYAIREQLNPDGSLITGHSASCILCHSVGNNQATGYIYNTNSFGPTNYTSSLANVGCESCHGPAGWHKNSDHAVITPVVSLDPAICGSCHQGATHPTFTEYTNVNATALSNAPAGIVLANVNHYGGGHNQNGCTWCHNAYNRDLMVQEYYDKQAGNSHSLAFNFASSVPTWSAACATCHDPHGSNNIAQLRYPTFSTNYYTIPTTTDTRTAYVTNYNGSITTNTMYMNTVVDNLYNPKVQVCAQCHNGRGIRWDGTAYGLTTNYVPNSITNTVYYNIYTTNTFTQVFTNSSGVPYLTNNYTSYYITGRGSYVTNYTTTNTVVGVGAYYPLVAYTNNGTVYYTTNASGFSSPHYNPQYNILIGQLDYDYASVAGVPNVLNDPHELSPNQCADCHVPKYSTGAHSTTTGHSFVSDNNGCLASCHSAYSNNVSGFLAKINNTKTTVTNGITRVVSLLNQWGTATNVAPNILRTNYGQLAWEYPTPGSLGTKSGVYQSGPPAKWNGYNNYPTGTNDNLQLSTVPQDIRIARHSIYMIWRDQSLGVHNPTYVKALLVDAETRVANQFVGAAYPAYFTGDTLSSTNGQSLTVNFTNPVGSGAVYSWNFGDGGSASAANPSHTFAAPGVYTVTCTVDGNPFIRTKYISVQ
jgi:PKD domain/Cytochrome c554 and c-prime